MANIELSTAPADAALDGSEKLLTLEFKNLTLQQAADWNESKSADIPSAGTTDIGAATTPFLHVPGTTTITAFGTKQAGTARTLVFDGALTLTHNATSLILPTGANITTAAGDVAMFRSEGSGNWRCVGYMRADGTPLAGGGGGGAADDITYDNTASGLAATDVQEAIDELTALGGTTTVTIVTEATAFTAEPATHAGLAKYVRAGGDVTFDSAETYAAGEVYNIRATGSIELIEDGVTLTPPSGGTLEMTAAMSVTVIMTSSTAGDVMGQTVPA